MDDISLFTINNDILDIIKKYYWNIKYKSIIMDYLIKWREKRPLYKLFRKVHEGRAFLKGGNIGPLIGNKGNNKYINGYKLEDIVKYTYPKYEQVRWGLRFSN